MKEESQNKRINKTTQVNDNRKSLQNSEQTTRTVSSRAPPEPVGLLTFPKTQDEDFTTGILDKKHAENL